MDEEYTFESHIHGLLLEDVEYCLLLFLRDGAKHPPRTPDGDKEVLGFLRSMVREIRKVSDQLEFKVNFTEECIERGMTLEEAGAEFEKYLEESGDLDDTE